MKGSAHIDLNVATTLEAMQLWLDTHFKTPPKATSIVSINSGNAFRLTIAEPEAGKGASNVV